MIAANGSLRWLCLSSVVGRNEAHYHMNTQRDSGIKGLWAILWRSIIFLPYMLLIFVSIGGIWLSRWLLPVCGAVLLYDHDWRAAGIVFALWLVLFWAYRHFRLCRYLESPSSLL
jgi:hypothetical protein